MPYQKATTEQRHEMKQERAITEVLRRYLIVLQQIDQEKKELATITDEAAEIPGVEKRLFKSLAKAIHEAPGTTGVKLESLEDFIGMAFQAPGDELRHTEVSFDFIPKQ